MTANRANLYSEFIGGKHRQPYTNENHYQLEGTAMKASIEKERIARDKQHYIVSWESYISQLNDLIWSTDEKDGKTLQDAVNQLKEIVKNNANRAFN